jgi:hypothetical protein
MELSTFGDNLADAAYMAQDVLRGWLDVGLEYGDPIPRPSNPAELHPQNPDEFISLVGADIDPYQVPNESAPVTKTITLPHWLDKRAHEENLDLDALVQEAVMEKVAYA